MRTITETSFTNAFCTATDINKMRFPTVPGFKPCALDIGYGGVKFFSNNVYGSFLSFARKIDNENTIGKVKDDHILFRDNSGLWAVGGSALEKITINDTQTSEAGLYAQHRYDSDMFGVLWKTAMAYCLDDPDWMNYKNIYLQTGLPPIYWDTDKAEIIDALSGRQYFEIKIGASQWKQVHFNLPEDRVFVMKQPAGAIYCAAADKQFEVSDEDAEKYFSQRNAIVFDPGFGTADTYVVIGGHESGYETFTNLGMKHVYQLIADAIKKEYNERIPIYAMQKILAKGTVEVLDRKHGVQKEFDVSGIVRRANQAVCGEAVKELIQNYDYLRDFERLIVTGGTGESWYQTIKEKFAGIETLDVVASNCQDTGLGFRYSNARGYYARLIGYLRGKAGSVNRQ